MPPVVSKQLWRQALLVGTVTASLTLPLTEPVWAQAGSLEMEPTDSLPAVAHSTADEPVHGSPRSSSGAFTVPTSEAQRVLLDHPQIVDTASLQSGTRTIHLFGIEGVAGEAADGLRSFLASTDERLTCERHGTTGSVCLLSDGTDIAQVALVNGAARTGPDAPDSYREQEQAAQAERRGIWENLPPPPETIIHPTVMNTAVLMAGGQNYPLDGLDGLGQPYASQLQGYIAANGDSLSCSAQGRTGYYICLMADGTDIAKVALVNGAARVSTDAPDTYRLQQAEALNNHRGYWLNATPEMLALATAVQPDMYAILPGDNGEDGITYVGGAPMAMIDGQPVVLEYGDAAGWGYYDQSQHWHSAPANYSAHMDHYHPAAQGLRGYRQGDGSSQQASLTHQQGMSRQQGMSNQQGMSRQQAMSSQPGMRREEGFAHQQGGFPHQQGGFSQQASMSHEMGVHPAVAHTGMAPGMAGHPGPAGGGFVRPTAMASSGGFHPGGAPQSHAGAPAVHAAAPAAHAAPPPPKHH